MLDLQLTLGLVQTFLYISNLDNYTLGTRDMSSDVESHSGA